MPVGIINIEDLRQRAPADVFNQCGFFCFRCRPILGVERPQRLDRGKVPLKFLFRSAVTDAVGFRDAVTVEIARRFILMPTMRTRWRGFLLLVADCKVAGR